MGKAFFPGVPAPGLKAGATITASLRDATATTAVPSSESGLRQTAKEHWQTSEPVAPGESGTESKEGVEDGERADDSQL
jgi:hypothetical protein